MTRNSLANASCSPGWLQGCDQADLSVLRTPWNLVEPWSGRVVEGFPTNQSMNQTKHEFDELTASRAGVQLASAGQTTRDEIRQPSLIVDNKPATQWKAEFEDLQSCVFVSDLHLFSSRSDADSNVQRLSEFQSESQCIVLGGDIFDLRWSRKGGLQPTTDAALAWLYQLLDQTGQSRILYLAGNHDCHPQFAKAMQSLSEECQRFHWFEHALQIGDSLFIHGDILHAEPYSGGLSSYRAKHHQHESPHPLLNQAYDLAVSMRLHKAVARLGNSPKSTCARLQSLVKGLPPQCEHRVRRIFFGHTHVSIPGLELGDQTFFNPGAMLKQTKNSPVHFEL